MFKQITIYRELENQLEQLITMPNYNVYLYTVIDDLTLKWLQNEKQQQYKVGI